MTHEEQDSNDDIIISGGGEMLSPHVKDPTTTDDDDDILLSETSNTSLESNNEPSSLSEDVTMNSGSLDNLDDGDSVVSTPTTSEEEDDVDMQTNDVVYGEDVDFRGESRESIIALISAREQELGAKALDNRVRSIGSWENLLFRAFSDASAEEMRIQEALASMDSDTRRQLSDRYKSEGKTLLRTSSIVENIAAGETKVLTGDAALLAFECQEKGGGYRIPLYNSGITIDVIIPTGNDVQTLLANCLHADKQLGSSNGAHYFAYNDLVFKGMILNFLQPLIVNSSYIDWKKKNKLWSVIKITDLPAIIATLAALMYKDGYEGFVVKCTRPKSEDHPHLCGFTENLTVNIFNLIVTRFATMSKDAIDFMVAARIGNARHNVGQIAKYQSDLGFEGEKITFGNVTFTMKIPTLAEHTEAGQKFIADVINEIEADNTDGFYEQFGFRYIRTFLPWIGMVEQRDAQGGIRQTNEPRVIIRILEKISGNDPDDKVIETLRQYVNKTQLTYVGYPVTACSQCGYTADTPSGMWTFDPFSAFFTLAFLYLKPKPLTAPKP